MAITFDRGKSGKSKQDLKKKMKVVTLVRTKPNYPIKLVGP